MLVMTDRFGLKRSIQRSASLTLKWLGCGAYTQPVDDPEIEVFDRAPALRGNVADVGRIGGTRDAIAKRRDVAMLHDEGLQRHRLRPARRSSCSRRLRSNGDPGLAGNRCRRRLEQ